MPESPTSVPVTAEAAGQRLDQFLASALNVSRARAQQLIAEEKVLVNDAPAKASLKLSAHNRGMEREVRDLLLESLLVFG